MKLRLLKVSTSTGQVLATSCFHARTFMTRLIGLLNHDVLKEGEALLLDPCNQIHTFFMHFKIDAVFLDRNDVVVAVIEIAPWRLSKIRFNAKKVLELPSGTCQKVGLKAGEKLEMIPCSN